MNPTLIIDRFEGQTAIIECGTEYFEIPIAALPEGAKEGDSLEINLSNQSQTQNETEERLARLKSQDAGDDIIDL